MKMLKDNPDEVTLEQLKVQLLKQAERLKDATPYRKRTVQLAMEVLEQCNDTLNFSSKESTLKLVSTILKNEDEERQKDVAKMLYVQHGYLFNELNYTDEFRKLKEENRRKLKGEKIRFVKVKGKK